MEITKFDKKIGPKGEVKPRLKTQTLTDRITEYKVVQILADTDEYGGASAGHIAKRLKLTRGRICQVLKRLEKEEYIISDTKVVKCYLCTGTGISALYPDKPCLSCKGDGTTIRKGNPVFYSINPEVKDEIKNLVKIADEYKKLESKVFRK